MAKKHDSIERQKIIVAEGLDALHFLRHALIAYEITDMQILDYGGIRNLKNYLLNLSKMDNYDKVETLIIARDAETDPNSAIDSIRIALQAISLNFPKKPFEYTEGPLRVAYMLFPGYADNEEPLCGTLEDLCLRIVEANPVLETTKEYISNINKKHHELTHPHKSHLHAYLAAHNQYVGLKIGEASGAGAWNWHSQVLAPYKKLLKEA